MTQPARMHPTPLAQPGSLSPLSLPERAALAQNDADNAARLLSAHGDRLLYVVNRGWAVWDGTRYAFTAGDLAAFGVASSLRDLIEEEAHWLRDHATVEDWEAQALLLGKGGAACLRQLDPMAAAAEMLRAKKAADRFKHATACGNVERINKALEYAKHMTTATVDRLDADPWVFVVQNGELDLKRAGDGPGGDLVEDLRERASWLRPVDRTKLPTRASPATYDPRATCPKWLDFMDLALPVDEDRAAFQRCAGYLLFGANPEAACFVFRGPGGNGKSTILNAINRVFGTLDGYSETVDIDMFMVTPQKATGGHNADEIDLIGGRVYIGTEPAPTDTFAMKKIKSLTGGDQKKSRAAYEARGVKWTPRGKPVLSCNKTPRFADDDPGTRRRMIFVPLETDFKALPEDMRKSEQQALADIEEEVAGILNWFLDGWRGYRRQGLGIPQRWRDMRDTLMEDADPVGQFIRENLLPDPAGRVRRAHFNAMYRAWAEEEGGANWSGRAVNTAMKEKGHRTVKVQGDECWCGFRWNPDRFDLVERVTGQRPPPPPTAPAETEDDPPPF